jgi:hypothetical protein
MALIADFFAAAPPRFARMVVSFDPIERRLRSTKCFDTAPVTQ